MTDNENPNVLIIDDSRTVRTMLKRALELSGFSVAEADCGEKGLEIIKAKIPDVVLCDVEMPGIGGFETCQQIRKLSQGKHLPIMMITSSEGQEAIDKAYQAGATDFTSKPINWDIIGHRVRYMMRNGHDFAELQKTKIALSQLNAELEQRVIQRTTELKNALDELQATQGQLVESEKLASLGGLVAGIAHEINTPIGISYTAVSMLQETTNEIQSLYNNNTLKRDDFSKYIEANQEMVKLLDTNLQRAITLVKSFKQTSGDQISENRRTFNLKEYLEEILVSIKPALAKNKLNTVINCPSNLIIDTYPGVLFQVITIFFMNTIKHAYEPNQEGTITIDAKLTDEKIELHYSDDGKGIPPENIKKIFDPFFTTQRGSGNLGLGLNIAYNKVSKQLGGTIKCTSTFGKGTVFTVIFPSHAI